jgi:DNA-binding transcriptional MerR regulator
MAEAAENLTLSRRSAKSSAAFRTISEVSEELDLPQHVLRFWETKFPHIRPLKRGGGRRYYRPEDVQLLRRIRNLLYNDGYTIKGVQKLLRQNGTKTQSNGSTEATNAATTSSLDDRRRTELEAVLGDLEELRDLLRNDAGT